MSSYGPVTIIDAPIESVLLGMADRGEWKWILSEDGVMLGFFPQGDAYEAAWHGKQNAPSYDEARIINIVNIMGE